MTDKQGLELLLNVIDGTISVDEANETLNIDIQKHEPKLTL